MPLILHLAKLWDELMVQMRQVIPLSLLVDISTIKKY